MTAFTKKIRQFFLPAVTARFVLRLLVVAAASYLIFSFVLIPFSVKGHSMAPTYRDGGINLCFRLTYLFSSPERHQVVIIRLAGKKVMLLKRIIALEGETVAFRKGKLLVNGSLVDEPYVRYPSDWTLPPRVVDKGNVYVVGDNRSVPIEGHQFGQTSVNRLMGVPLW